MIKKSIYKVIIFPIIFLFFSDLLPLLALCDENISEIANENTNEENSKNAFQALMLFISASIFLYFLRNGFPISFSGNESIDIASKITESTVNVTASSSEPLNLLQTKVTELGNENANLRNILEKRDAEIAQLRYQNDLLYQNNSMNEMQNRRYRTFIRSLREQDTRIDELTTQFYQNSGLRGRP